MLFHSGVIASQSNENDPRMHSEEELHMHRNVLPFISYRFKGEQVACPICASNQRSTISKIDRRLKPLTTVMCDDCGLFYSNPMPSSDELANYYQKEYRKDYQLALFAPSQKHITKKQAEAKMRYAVVRDELAGNKLHLLDFGCGSGELVHEYASHGHSAYGFEPGATYASHAQQQAHQSAIGSVDIRSADYQSSDYAPRQFDAITMLHVLEHIPHPLAALQKAHEWLKDDGILYIEVPNMQAYDLKGFEHFHFAHVLGFSRDNLIHALRLAGFRVRKEIDGTSLLAEKILEIPCTATIDLQATAERNRREYTAPFSLLAYCRYHLKRALKRLRRTQHVEIAKPMTKRPAANNTKIAVPSA